jgi:hypothetical protein
MKPKSQRWRIAFGWSGGLLREAPKQIGFSLNANSRGRAHHLSNRKSLHHAGCECDWGSTDARDQAALAEKDLKTAATGQADSGYCPRLKDALAQRTDQPFSGQPER